MTTRPRLDDPETAVRYLADKLASPEREAFEEHYLAHPKIVEEMELDAKLKAGLISIRDANELDRLTSVPRRSWMLAMAIAASLLLAVITILSLRYVLPEAVLAASPAGLKPLFGSRPPSGATYKLVQTRTGSYDAVIAASNDVQAIRLQIVLDIEPPMPSLQVSMAAIANDTSRTALVVLPELHADENGILTLYVNSAALGPGIYELEVSRETGSGPVPESTFVLQVVHARNSQPAR